MHRLSHVQLLSIWSDLEAAYYCRNGFGTDTAEIYMYRLMAWSPSYCLTDVKMKIDREASSTLKILLWYYAEHRDARIWINGQPLEALDKPEIYEHRVAVRVVPKRSREVASNVATLLGPVIADLTPEMRCELKAELFGAYCRSCCGSNPNCQCDNDE